MPISLDAQTETWGIKVSNVEIRTVELTENMVRAMTRVCDAWNSASAWMIFARRSRSASACFA